MEKKHQFHLKDARLIPRRLVKHLVINTEGDFLAPSMAAEVMDRKCD